MKILRDMAIANQGKSGFNYSTFKLMPIRVFIILMLRAFWGRYNGSTFSILDPPASVVFNISMMKTLMGINNMTEKPLYIEVGQHSCRPG
jgi:hypothetical protein